MLAAHQRRQHARLLLIGAVHHDGMGPEQVDVDSRSGGERTARCRHRLHHQRGFGHPKPGAAQFFRHGDAQPATLGHRLVEVARESSVAVARQPVSVIETGADALYRVHQRGMVLIAVDCHDGTNSR